MHIALCIPPIEDFYVTPGRLSALGAHTVSALLQENGHTVSLFNCTKPEAGKASAVTKTRKIPKELSYLTPYIIPGEYGPTTFFTHYLQYGTPYTACAEAVAESAPELVMIACFAFAYAEEALKLSQTLRNTLPNSTPIIMGGAGPSALPAYFLRDASVTGVYCGEAEHSLVHIIDQFSRGHTPDNTHNYFTRGAAAAFQSGQCAEEHIRCSVSQIPGTKKAIHFGVSYTRGCPKRCRFCSNFLTHGRSFRSAPYQHTVTAMLEKLAPVPQSTPVHICFEDDNMLADTPYFLALLSELRMHHPALTFSCENGIDYLLLTEELTRTLITSGMTMFHLSLGSVSPTLLKQEKRPYNFTAYEALLAQLAEQQIPVITYFIAGLAGDSRENIVSTLQYLALQPTRIGISPYYAVPNLPDHSLVEEFLHKPALLCKGSSLYPWHNLSTEELVTAFRLARTINACKLSPRQLSIPLSELLHLCFSTNRLYTLQKQGNKQEIIEVPRYHKTMAEECLSQLEQNSIQQLLY